MENEFGFLKKFQTGYDLSHEGGLNAFEFLNIEAKGAEQYSHGTPLGFGTVEATSKFGMDLDFQETNYDSDYGNTVRPGLKFLRRFIHFSESTKKYETQYLARTGH